MRSLAFVAVLAVGLSAFNAGAAVLYNGSDGGTPEDQGWLYTDLSGGLAIHGATGGVTTLNTTALNGIYAGYSQVAIMDRTTGFTVRFTVQIQSEGHSGSDDRAGFSVIVLSADSKGLELAFWEDEIWPQDDGVPLFTHGTGAAYNTTAALTQYDLAIMGSTYQVFAGGSPLFSGTVADYSDFGTPYDEINALFFGDDTSSAQAEVDITWIEVLDYAVPEPGAAALLALGAMVLMFRRRRGGSRRRRRQEEEEEAREHPPAPAQSQPEGA